MKRLFGVCGICVLFCSLAFGQGTTGSIDITVTDSSGSIMPGVSVSAINIETGAETKVTTDEVGRCLFPLLRAGKYRFIAEQSGFQKLQRDDVTVNAAESIHIDLRMALGAVSETITVTESTPLLQSEQATMGHVVDQRQIVSIPLATRNFTQLLGTSAGVVGSIFNADNPGTGSDTVSVNGARRGSNNLMVDGAPISNALNNAPDGDGTPSLEFLSEFKVLTSLFGAEYGKNLGGVINVTTRSGTNTFHGSAYEFLRNTKLNARPFFNPKRGQNTQNQFGGNLGGPIRRNKTFFFGGYEGTRQRNANAGSATLLKVVPTVAQRNGDFGAVKVTDPTTGQPFPNNVIPQSRFSPIAVNLTKQFIPLPNYSSGGATNFFAAQAIPTGINQYTARIDHRIGDHDTIYGRWFDSYEKDLAPFGQGLPGFGAWTNRQKHSATGSWAHVFSPTLVLDTGVAYDQTDQFKIFTDQNDMKASGLQPLPVTMTNDGLPDFQISNYVNFGNYQRWTDHVKTATGRADLTWVRGHHNLKFGFESRHDLYDDANTLTSRGRFFFTGSATGDGYADFLTGFTRNKAFGAGPGRVQHRDAVMSYYVADEWKINRNLTVTAGVRWEGIWLPATYNLQMTNWWPDLYRGIGSLADSGVVQGGVNGVPKSTIYNDMNNFMPRLGVAWRVANHWVVRAGAGLYFDQRTGQIAQQAFNNPPTFQAVQPDCSVAGSGCSLKTPDNFTFVDPLYDPKFIPFPKSPTDSLTYSSMERNTKTDNAWQYNFTLQRELPRNILVEAAYVGTKGTHLMANVVGNPLIPAGFDPSNPKPGTLARRYPGFGNNNITGQGGSSSFNSFQLTVKKRVAAGTVQLAYTIAKTLSNGGDDGNRFYTSMALTPWWDWSRARGPAGFDRPQRLSLMFVQDLPKFFASGPGKQLFNNWSFTGLMILQSGVPLNVTNVTSGQGLGGAATDPTAALYANVISGVPLVNPGSTKEKLNNYINKAAWSKAPAGTVGNSGRGMYRGPGQANVDFSLFKNIAIRERTKLEFRTEFFNILNHANFGNPSTSLDSGSFGQISSTTVNARLVQFALKLSF